MPEPIKSNPRLKAGNTAKNGQRVAERMPTNVSGASPPEPILSVLNSLNVLEKQFSADAKRESAAYDPSKLTKPMLTPGKVKNWAVGANDKQTRPVSEHYLVHPKILAEEHIEHTNPIKLRPLKRVDVGKKQAIQNSLINKNGTGPDIFSEKHTIKQPKEITLQTEESHYVPDKKVVHIPTEKHELRLNPHTLTGGTASTVKYPKISREAIMQNSEIINKEAKEPFAIATAKVKEMGYDDLSEGSEGREKRDEIVEAIKKKENIPISKATLLCKLEKQIFTIEHMGIPDDYILKAYGSFDYIPENLIKQENRPPIGWFEKALGTLQKSDYSGNQYRYLVELWKSSDGADEILQKTIVKPLDGDEFFERERLVQDAESGGEAEVSGDGTKVKTEDLAPVKTTSTN